MNIHAKRNSNVELLLWLRRAISIDGFLSLEISLIMVNVTLNATVPLDDFFYLIFLKHLKKLI